jgi:DNA-directed RNA polymerase subunit RPC12/RpoP
MIVVDVEKKIMHDYIHRCLKCAALCYEKEKDLYECPKCGFSWEVIEAR